MRACISIVHDCVFSAFSLATMWRFVVLLHSRCLSVVFVSIFARITTWCFVGSLIRMTLWTHWRNRCSPLLVRPGALIALFPLTLKAGARTKGIRFVSYLRYPSCGGYTSLLVTFSSLSLVDTLAVVKPA